MNDNPTHPTRLDIPESIHAAAVQAARARGMSLKAWVVDAMIDKLNRSTGFVLPGPADSSPIPVYEGHKS